MRVTSFGVFCLTTVGNLGSDCMKWPIHWEKRTSITHPIKVDWITNPRMTGKIGITLCPGKCQPISWSGGWNRDLETDVARLLGMEVHTIISLIEQKEMEELQVPNLGDVIQRHQINWIHLPIPDTTVPTNETMENLESFKDTIVNSLLSEEKVVVHCKGGLGRAATIVCMILNWFNVPTKQSIDHIRKVRSPDCVNPEQEEFLLKNCQVNIRANGQ